MTSQAFGESMTGVPATTSMHFPNGAVAFAYVSTLLMEFVYLPSKKIAIAVAVTFAPEAFDSQGNYANSSDTLFRSIGGHLAPDDAPPLPPVKG